MINKSAILNSTMIKELSIALLRRTSFTIDKHIVQELSSITNDKQITSVILVKNIMEDAIVALGIEKQEGGTEKEYQWYDKKYYTVENVIGLAKKEATSILKNVSVEYSGSGNNVISQSPEAGSRIVEGENVRLYLG